MTPRERVAAVDWRLYVVLDPAMCLPGASWLEVAEAALAGGARVLQLRDKHADSATLYARACALTELCETYGAICIINDRLDVAMASGAHGVHLGPNDLPLDAARRVAAGLILGGSTGDVARAQQLVAQGVDYLGVGALFDAHASKSDASAPRGTQIVTDVAAALPCPIVGIGGINAHNLALVRDAGAHGAAVIRAVCGQPDPADAARRLLAIWGTARG